MKAPPDTQCFKFFLRGEANNTTPEGAVYLRVSLQMLALLRSSMRVHRISTGGFMCMESYYIRMEEGRCVGLRSAELDLAVFRMEARPVSHRGTTSRYWV